MEPHDLLGGVLEFFEGQIQNVDFRRGWDDAWRSRLLERPLVSGVVERRSQQEADQSTSLYFTVFAPEPAQGEALADVLWELVRDNYPGCREVVREKGKTDALTRLSCCGLRFVFPGDLASQAAGIAVTLGGKACSVAAVSVAADVTGRELVAVGEEEPFALENSRIQYQVMLEGLEVSGLERLASFTAEIGQGVYEGCRWKSLDMARRQAVFVASRWREKEE